MHKGHILKKNLHLKYPAISLKQSQAENKKIHKIHIHET